MTNQDKIYKLFLDSNNKTNEALFGIKEALNSINDQNKLHCDLVMKNGDKMDRNHDDISDMIAATNSIAKTFRTIMIALVFAIIALAGAEKIIKLIPLT
jgi:hypothetical protein